MDRRDLERRLRDAENRLRARPAAVALHYERAQLLARLGRTDDARLGYAGVLQLDATHFGALNELGRILFAAGLRNDALTCFRAAVAKHPRNAIGHANLGFVLLHGGDAQGAKEQYEWALRLDPNNPETHRGLTLALKALGDDAGAQRHAEAGFARQPLVELGYRGEAAPIRVLLAVSATAGNVPAERFLDDRIFATTKLIAEYASELAVLPAHDLLFNAVGDADICAPALHAMAALSRRTAAPVVNAPPAVLATGREANARRLRELPNVVAPRIATFARDRLNGDEAQGELEREGFTFPLLLRAPGFHAGEHFERVERPEELRAAVERLPGDRLLAIEYLDARGDDGNVRKYRAIVVGSALYPLHVAIAPHWKVHYFSAQMARRSDYRAEEAAYVQSMDATVGTRAAAALHAVREMLSLDYGGIDFAVAADGKAIVFEANATMAVPRADADAPPYRRDAIARIEGAVAEMLSARAGRPRSS